MTPAQDILATIEKAAKLLTDNSAPDDGRRYAVIGQRQWDEQLKIPEFANAPLSPGTEDKLWLGTRWILFKPTRIEREIDDDTIEVTETYQTHWHPDKFGSSKTLISKSFIEDQSRRIADRVQKNFCQLQPASPQPTAQTIESRTTDGAYLPIVDGIVPGEGLPDGHAK